MKYVSFIKPILEWDGYDWLYKLSEGQNPPYHDFFLVEAKNPEKARDLVVDEIYKDAIKENGINILMDEVYQGFCDLEFEKDEDIIQILGKKDGIAALKLYKKYGWESFFDNKVDFHNTLTRDEREIFYSFDAENVEKLYKQRIRYDVLIMTITKEL